ncbi:hypothetical protein GCM10010169_50840 [Micromonospora fulviviridis]|uniref:hypothetical protein n=1 Tax=Micromonospora fulviviridis TaxID=47860 RepID=UPI0016675854|nr:hypothetical protein [Micromonospora fulviviridis]GGR99954.1 hypothetical protein GCM10010169_50840 [Micromonospora fulviviridis]
MAKPKGPHGGTGDGGDGGEVGDGGVPRQRSGGQHGRPTTVAESHRAIAEAAESGRPGGPRSTDGRPGGSEGDTGSPRPQNDPELGKHDEQTLEEIAKARQQIAGQLQDMADDAWDHVDQNRDSILQQDGYQRQRDKLIEKGYPEDVADLIVERTALGTESHRHLANAIDSEATTMLDPETGFRLRTEVGYDAQGVETPKVKDQDFRPDVILERQYKDPVTDETDWEVAHAYDLKTGLKTGIEPSWANKVQRVLDLPEPPEELRPTQRPLSVD